MIGIEKRSVAGRCAEWARSSVMLVAGVIVLVVVGSVRFGPMTFQTADATTLHDCRGGGAGRSLLRTELFLGRSKHDGTTVTDQAFRTFLDSVIAPRFPDGFAILAGIGQYRGAGGAVVRERSLVLVLLHAPEAKAETRIEEIRHAYKGAFSQESVLRVDVNACASF